MASPQEADSASDKGFATSSAATSLESPESSSPPDSTSPLNSPDLPRRVPSLRTVSAPNQASGSALPAACSIREVIAVARNPRLPPAASTLISASSDNDVVARLRDFQNRRLGPSPSPAAGGGLASNLRLPGALRPGPGMLPKSAPVVPRSRPMQSLSERRMRLSGADSPLAGTPRLSDLGGGGAGGPEGALALSRSKMEEYQQYIDAERGWITFTGAATITNKGVNFANGQTFAISLDEIRVLGELGKGNYGTVFKVRHARSRAPRLGLGLAGARVAAAAAAGPAGEKQSSSGAEEEAATVGRVMAMKEIRLELDDAKFTAILKELVILHECVSPYVVDFYGAFFQEGAVYLCMEYMDGGSLDKLYRGGIPEPVLRSMTLSTVLGLKALKDELNIIHRDVKPTNILANTRGHVKICDFGVSGNLVASIARTNIGCQSYMAPERISGGADTSMAGGGPTATYSVQSDIWSLGLTIIECAMGRYPYPPEVSSTIFSQLTAIVDGEPPDMPAEGYSEIARDFARGCLHKSPHARPSYAMLLQHPWLQEADPTDGMAELNLHDGDPTVAAWVRAALAPPAAAAAAAAAAPTPALHSAPLDASSAAD